MGRPKTLFELDLVQIAVWHKRCSVLAIVMVFAWLMSLFVSLGVGPSMSQSVSQGIILGTTTIWVLGTLVSVVFVVMLQLACGRGVVSVCLYALLTLLLSWLVLLASVSGAATILRLAGLRVGTLGVSSHEVDKARRGHCRGCGYAREGIGLLDPCPECERVPMVI